MLVLLSCAKTMSDVSKVKVPLTTVPRFQKEASEIALQMSQFAVGDLERLLRVNAKIAVENYKRYQAFHAEETPELPALFSYTGIVFKRLNPKDFSASELEYAQEHLRLTSFCYGLLRPLDVIRPYRLEGDVVLPELVPCFNRVDSFSERRIFIFPDFGINPPFTNSIRTFERGFDPVL